MKVYGNTLLALVLVALAAILNRPACADTQIDGSVVTINTEAEHLKWLSTKMSLAYTIKVGMSIEQLLEVFRRENGLAYAMAKEKWMDAIRSGNKNAPPPVARTYSLRSCTCIKVDVRFLAASPHDLDPEPGTKIEWVSKPYLELEHID